MGHVDPNPVKNKISYDFYTGSNYDRDYEKGLQQKTLQNQKNDSVGV